MERFRECTAPTMEDFQTRWLKNSRQPDIGPSLKKIHFDRFLLGRRCMLEMLRRWHWWRVVVVFSRRETEENNSCISFFISNNVIFLIYGIFYIRSAIHCYMVISTIMSLRCLKCSLTNTPHGPFKPFGPFKHGPFKLIQTTSNWQRTPVWALVMWLLRYRQQDLCLLLKNTGLSESECYTVKLCRVP